MFSTAHSRETKETPSAQGVKVSFSNRKSLEQNAVGDVYSVEDVLEWLGMLGLPEYADKFRKNEIDGEVLPTLSWEELRDDLAVVNLTHRRVILDAIHGLSAKSKIAHVKRLPEHGRILVHLSSTRTYHFWFRVGTQLLAFSFFILLLEQSFPIAPLITAFSIYLNISSIVSVLYGLFRYIIVQDMIEVCGTRIEYRPENVGLTMIVVLLLISSVFGFVLIFVGSFTSL